MNRTLFAAGTLAAALIAAPAGALTYVNPLGAGTGNERCLEGGNCPGTGSYAGLASIQSLIEADRGITLTRVDDAFDTLWRATGTMIEARAIARYAGDSAGLGIGSGGGSFVSILASPIGNSRIGYLNTAVPKVGEPFVLGSFTSIAAPSAPFAWILNNLTQNYLLASDTSLTGYANSGLAADWMVTFRSSSGDSWFIAFEDRIGPLNANGPFDHDFNDYVFEVRGVMPVPEPSTWAMLGAGLVLLAAAVRRRQPSSRLSARALSA